MRGWCQQEQGHRKPARPGACVPSSQPPWVRTQRMVPCAPEDSSCHRHPNIPRILGSPVSGTQHLFQNNRHWPMTVEERTEEPCLASGLGSFWSVLVYLGFKHSGQPKVPRVGTTSRCCNTPRILRFQDPRIPGPWSHQDLCLRGSLTAKNSDTPRISDSQDPRITGSQRKLDSEES